jgi:hypothetical protein
MTQRERKALARCNDKVAVAKRMVRIGFKVADIMDIIDLVKIIF